MTMTRHGTTPPITHLGEYPLPMAIAGCNPFASRLPEVPLQGAEGARSLMSCSERKYYRYITGGATFAQEISEPSLPMPAHFARIYHFSACMYEYS
jgi:hypothetical protein